MINAQNQNASLQADLSANTIEYGLIIEDLKTQLQNFEEYKKQSQILTFVSLTLIGISSLILFSKFIFWTWALVTIFKLDLFFTGFKYPLAALHLSFNPALLKLVVNWKKPTPKLSPVLKSFVLGIPYSSLLSSSIYAYRLNLRPHSL